MDKGIWLLYNVIVSRQKIFLNFMVLSQAVNILALKYLSTYVQFNLSLCHEIRRTGEIGTIEYLVYVINSYGYLYE